MDRGVDSAVKAREFAVLFPGKMPSSWGCPQFKPEDFYTESDDLKSEVARLITEHPQQRAQIVEIYGTLFEEETTRAFLKRLLPGAKFPPPRRTNSPNPCAQSVKQ